MHSKNKSSMSPDERMHVARIKQMNCAVCEASGPSECHEIKQGLWFTSLPLCSDCHRGGFNGIHGQRRIWNVKKLDEMSVLNETIRALYNETLLKG